MKSNYTFLRDLAGDKNQFCLSILVQVLHHKKTRRISTLELLMDEPELTNYLKNSVDSD